MPAQVSAALAEAWASAVGGGLVIAAVELRHPSFNQPIRVCTDEVDRSLVHESDAPLNPGAAVSYTAMGFNITPPASEEGSSSKARLALDNVPGQLWGYLNAALTTTSPIDVSVRIYSEADTTGPGEVYEGLVLRQVHLTGTRAEGELTYEQIGSKMFPRRIYDRTLYPSLQ